MDIVGALSVTVKGGCAPWVAISHGKLKIALEKIVYVSNFNFLGFLQVILKPLQAKWKRK